MPSRPGFFLFAIFLSVVFCPYVHLKAFFEDLQPCFHVVYPFSIFVMIFPFPYFAPKSSLPLSYPVVDMASLILLQIVGRIFYIVLECLVLSILFGFVAVSF